MGKPILCLDFDGVIHAYTSGWQGAAVIPDPPVPGALEFIERAAQVFTVAIYSTRSHQPGGREAMAAWLKMHYAAALDGGWKEADRLLKMIEFPESKPPALVGIDDRQITFTGEWPALDALLNFRPWNKPAPKPETVADGTGFPACLQKERADG